MKYLAAYLLLVAGGKTEPTAADVKAVMASVGVEAEEERLTSLIAALKGKNTDELVTEGLEKMSSKEEEKEESDDDMGFGLFD
ncbi:hypothetical protein INT48_001561 [Thamnidium elegans]|uniref:60S acidic ribosomal protein P2 n=1 Tax=Thamnidium elegans TaxID=101142 RepID=A0A8H7SQ27_9FUNG|nr:hypothetical protein INT48_001561 [Thamnidium elegans]